MINHLRKLKKINFSKITTLNSNNNNKYTEKQKQCIKLDIQRYQFAPMRCWKTPVRVANMCLYKHCIALSGCCWLLNKFLS